MQEPGSFSSVLMELLRNVSPLGNSGCKLALCFMVLCGALMNRDYPMTFWRGTYIYLSFMNIFHNASRFTKWMCISKLKSFSPIFTHNTFSCTGNSHVKKCTFSGTTNCHEKHLYIWEQGDGCEGCDIWEWGKTAVWGLPVCTGWSWPMVCIQVLGDQLH